MPGASQVLKAPPGEEIEVRLRASADVAPYFLCQLYHSSQRIAAEHEDGSIDVVYSVADLAPVVSWVRLWEFGVSVLEPQELVDQLREHRDSVA